MSYLTIYLCTVYQYHSISTVFLLRRWGCKVPVALTEPGILDFRAQERGAELAFEQVPGELADHASTHPEEEEASPRGGDLSPPGDGLTHLFEVRGVHLHAGAHQSLLLNHSRGGRETDETHLKAARK